jgi:cobalamin biosynthesis Co2+ chelatase CbiK
LWSDKLFKIVPIEPLVCYKIPHGTNFKKRAHFLFFQALFNENEYTSVTVTPVETGVAERLVNAMVMNFAEQS